MLFEGKNLRHLQVIASDGDLGKVEEFYFDDEKWVIRYLVVSTGGLLDRHRVLISPISFQRLDLTGGKLWLSISREQIKESPDMEEHWPVSRQREKIYHQHFNWPSYWSLPGLWGLGPYGVPWYDPKLGQQSELSPYPHTNQNEIDEVPLTEDQDHHLRSSKEVVKYHIKAVDDQFGHLEDFIIDDRSWSIRYLVIDTINYFPSKSVLVAPDWTRSISWAHEYIEVDLKKDQIKSAPVYHFADLNLDYEERLYRHYGRPLRTIDYPRSLHDGDSSPEARA